MKEPVDHILRPRLPWRSGDGAVTECGYDASKVKTLSRDEYFARRKELGERRCALLTCMTCSDTASRWGTWEDDPRKALEREIAWETYFYRRNDHGRRLLDELLAIVELIDRYQEEFSAILLKNEQRREWLEKKAARKPRNPEHDRTIL